MNSCHVILLAFLTIFLSVLEASLYPSLPLVRRVSFSWVDISSFHHVLDLGCADLCAVGF